MSNETENSGREIALRATETQLDRLAFEPQNWEQAVRVGQYLFRSHLIPEGLDTENAVVAVLMKGRELSMTSMQSLDCMHVINGRVGLRASALVALVLRSGHAKYFSLIDANAKAAAFETLRIGDPNPVRMAYTIEEAGGAGLLGKDAWKKFPMDMLMARAKARLARTVYPDVIAGLYAIEELRDGGAIEHVEARVVAPDEQRLADLKHEFASYAALYKPREITEILGKKRKEIESANEYELAIARLKEDQERKRILEASRPAAPDLSSCEDQKEKVAELAPPAGDQDEQFVSISDFWRQLRSMGIVAGSEINVDAYNLYGKSTVGQITPEDRAHYLTVAKHWDALRKAGLTHDHVAADMKELFGVVLLREANAKILDEYCGKKEIKFNG